MQRDSFEFIQRGKVLIVRRKFQEAARVCRLGLLAHPSLVEGRLVLGMALMALAKYDEVLGEMRIALEREPKNALCLLLKGEALFRKGEHQQALEVLDRARALDPKNDKIARVVEEVRAEWRQRAVRGDDWSEGPGGVVEVTDTKVYPAVMNPASSDDQLPSFEPETLELEGQDLEEISEEESRDTEDTFVDDDPLARAARKGARAAAPIAAAATDRPRPRPRVPTTLGPPPPTLGLTPGLDLDAAPTPPPLLTAPAPSRRRPASPWEDDEDSDAAATGEIGGLSGEIILTSGEIVIEPPSEVRPTEPPPSAREPRPAARLPTREPPPPAEPRPAAPAREPARLPTREPVAPREPPIRPSDSDQSRSLHGELETRPFVSPHREPVREERPVVATVDEPRGPPSGGITVVRERSAPIAEAPRPRAAEPARAQRTRWTWQRRLATGIVLGLALLLGAGGGWLWHRARSVARQRAEAMAHLASGAYPRFRNAVDLLARLAADRPDDSTAEAELSLARAIGALEFGDPLGPATTQAGGPLGELVEAYRALVADDLVTAERRVRVFRELVSRARPGAPAPIGRAAYLLGRVALLRWDAAEASRAFTEALAAAPDDAFAARGLAVANARMGDLDRAQQILDALLAKRRDLPLAVIERVRLQLVRGIGLESLGETLDKLLASPLGPNELTRVRLLAVELATVRGERERARAQLKEVAQEALGDSPRLRLAEDQARLAHAALAADVAGLARSAALRALDHVPSHHAARLSLAAALLAEGQPGPARAEVEKMLAALRAGRTSDPSLEAEALVVRARARHALGETTLARRDLQAAATLVPNLLSVRLSSLRFDAMLGGAAAGRAAKAARQLLGEQGPVPDLLETLGLAEIATGQSTARSDLERAAAESPQTFEARLALARLLREEGRHADALKLLREAAEAAPRHFAVLAALGSALVDVGDLVEARKIVPPALAEAATDPGLLMVAVELEIAPGGTPERARALLERARAAGVAPSKLLRVSAQAALAAGRPREAFRLASQLASARPDDAGAQALAYEAFAATAPEARRIEKLEKRLNKKFARAPELLLVRARLAAQAGLSQPELALAASRALRTARFPPRVVAEALTLLGRAYYEAGDLARAAAAFDDARAEDQGSAEAHYYLALVLIELERTEDARRALEQAVTRQGTFAPAHLELARILKRGGDRDGARRAYDSYLRLVPAGELADTARQERSQL